MSGPLSGIGAQLTPINQTFQPGRGVENRQNQTVRQEQDALNGVERNSTDTGRTENVRQASAGSNDQQGRGDSSDGRRGGLVNISV